MCRILPSLCLFVSLSLLAAEDDLPKKRGGFTGATPKPITQHSATPAGTAKTKNKSASKEDASPDEPVAPPLKKRKPAAATDDGNADAVTGKETPAPKKKSKSLDETASEDKSAPTTDSPPKTTSSSDNVIVGTKREHAPAATVAPEEISEFAAQSPRLQALTTAALELTKLNLTYTYGSADPSQGGMDCSGAIYYLLRSQDFKDVPRDSSSQYVWARQGSPFFAVVSKSADSFEFKDLKPGDLLFWTGTYETGREIPISHVMLYLGTEKKTKKRIMFGSSDGRSYDGVQRWGVSVFDFKMPKADPANPEKAKVDFVGYGRIPGLDVAVATRSPSVGDPEEKITIAPTPAPKKVSSARRKH